MYGHEIREAAAWIAAADALVICAGAGMGVDSGLPDFRGDQGFWKAYPPMARLGISFVEMANPSWFIRDPRLAWGFYGHRLNLYRRTVPHNGFQLLKQWSEQKAAGAFVFTSNVDGQFQKAGFLEAQIEEVHGSIHHLQCNSGCSQNIWPAGGTEIAVDEETFLAESSLPACPACGDLARPNILMFGDWDWLHRRSQEQSDCFRQWLGERRKGNLAVVECGAGTAVPSVRHLSEQLVREFNAHLVRINLREAHVPPGQVGLPLGARDTLERINELIG